jgi:hypothetical protein
VARGVEQILVGQRPGPVDQVVADPPAFRLDVGGRLRAVAAVDRGGGMIDLAVGSRRSVCWPLNWLLCATKGTAAQLSGPPWSLSARKVLSASRVSSSAAAKLSKPASAARKAAVSPAAGLTAGMVSRPSAR